MIRSCLRRVRAVIGRTSLKIFSLKESRNHLSGKLEKVSCGGAGRGPRSSLGPRRLFDLLVEPANKKWGAKAGHAAEEKANEWPQRI